MIGLQQEAQQLGLPERKAITDRLEQLKKLEEVEGIWQCLSTCLRDADRLGVVFWSQEAEQMGLEVPEVLMPALDAMRDEEAARLKRMELEASFNAQAAEAHARKDVQALRAMAQHAKASGQDPSAALAALEDLGEAEEVEEEELERLFVSSPNGQNHCFGMYVLVREERGNGMPVWRQLGGERWIYTDELGRWTVGSSKVRQNGFRGSAGFIFCPQKNHGVLPDKMQFWARFDEEAKKWKKDQQPWTGRPYLGAQVIEPKFSKRAKGAKGKGKGAKGGKEEKPKARAKPKAAPRPDAKAHARPPFAQPAHHSGLTQPQAMRILELPSDRLCDLREEVINKAYRRLALRWHPDRHCNRHKKEDRASDDGEGIRELIPLAELLMRDFLKAKKPIQDISGEWQSIHAPRLGAIAWGEKGRVKGEALVWMDPDRVHRAKETLHMARMGRRYVELIPPGRRLAAWALETRGFPWAEAFQANCPAICPGLPGGAVPVPVWCDGNGQILMIGAPGAMMNPPCASETASSCYEDD
eukprot:s1318_g4.t1